MKQRLIGEVVMPHAIQTLTPAQFEAYHRRANNMRNTNANSVAMVVHYEDGDHFALVGSDALGLEERRKGVTKYVKRYMDVYLIAALHKMFPDGHNSIVIGIGHPPNALPYLNSLMEVIRGKHTATIAGGKKTTWNIKAAIAYDENAGGLVRATSMPTIQFDHSKVENGDIYVICDVGGEVGSIYLAEIQNNKPVILFDEGQTFETGIEHVKFRLIEALRASNPDTFKWDKQTRIIEQIIRTRGTAMIRGKEHRFIDEFNYATKDLLHIIRNVYENKLRGALEARRIYLSGGGSGVLEDSLRNDIFGGSTVRLTDRPEDIHKANARGGAVMVYQKLEHEYYTDTKVKKLLDNGTAVLLIDAGNSQLKGGIVDLT